MTETDARYRHASGEDDAGCIACQVDALFEGATADDGPWCLDADPDPIEPELCAVCSHTVERVA